MWPDRVSNPGPLTYESGALPTALRGPAAPWRVGCACVCKGAGGERECRHEVSFERLWRVRGISPKSSRCFIKVPTIS